MFQVFPINNTSYKDHVFDVNPIVLYGPPIFESIDKNIAIAVAKAWLIENSDETVYLAQSGQVLESYRNDAVDELKDKASRNSVNYIVYILFLTTYSVAASLYAMPWYGMLCLITIILFYRLLCRIGLANEMVCALFCEMILIISIMVLPLTQLKNFKW